MNKPVLKLIHNFCPGPAGLFETLQGIEWDTSMSARHTASFGVPYNYSQMHYGACDLHPALVPVAELLEETLEIPFNNCLLNFYPAGDSSMGFHSDDTSNLLPGTGVAIVSLGSTRDITFRSQLDKTRKLSYSLPAGSLLYMPPEVQDDWTHAILRKPEAGPRMSLTWRAIEKIEA